MTINKGLGDLELILHSISMNPELFGIRSNNSGLVPFPKYDDMDSGEQMLLEEALGDFVYPQEGKVHFFDRIERLSRLPEADYEVYVPEHEIQVHGKTVTVPEGTVTLTHKRSHHSSSSFDPSILLTDNLKYIETSEDEFGTISKMVNVQITGRDFTNVYSDFFTKTDVGPEWNLLECEFEDFYKSKLIPHNKEMYEFIDLELKKGTSLKSLKKIIRKRDTVFFSKHEKKIQEVCEMVGKVTSRHYKALNRLTDTYTKKVYGIESPRYFKESSHIGLDSEGRIFSGANLIHPEPITLNKARKIGMKFEKMPFNKKFQDEIIAELKNIPKKEKEYGLKAKAVLRQALDTYFDGHYATSLTRASTALEVALKGYLIDKKVLNKEDFDDKDTNTSLRMMMGRYYDLACKNDPANTNSKTRNYFNPRIKGKIISLSREKQYPDMHEIRCSETHEAGNIYAHANDVNIAYIGIRAYSEAIDYILNDGWKDKDIPVLPSEVIMWESPHLNGFIPHVASNQVMDMLKEALPKALEYLTPLELQIFKRNVAEYSWAKGIIKDKISNKFS